MEKMDSHDRFARSEAPNDAGECVA